MRSGLKLVTACFLALMLLLVGGCNSAQESSGPTQIARLSDLPQPVRDWAEQYKYLDVGTSMEYNGRVYLLYANPTQQKNADVEIAGITETDREIIVRVRDLPGSNTGEDWRYPFALWSIRAVDKPIRFEKEGEIQWVSSIVGAPSNFKLFVGRDYVHMYDSFPATNIILGTSEQNGIVEGLARTFEATVNYRLVNSNGQLIKEDYVTAAAGMGDWGYFSIDISDYPQTAIVEVFEYSAKDGSEINKVHYQLQVK